MDQIVQLLEPIISVESFFVKSLLNFNISSKLSNIFGNFSENTLANFNSKKAFILA